MDSTINKQLEINKTIKVILNWLGKASIKVYIPAEVSEFLDRRQAIYLILYTAIFHIKEKTGQKHNILFLPNVLFNFHGNDALATLQMESLYVMS